MSYFGTPLYPASLPNPQSVVNISGNTTLGVGAASYSKQFLISGAGNYTITLLALDATNWPSQSFSIFNNSSALCNVTAAGSDTMLLLGSSYTSIAILPGERFLVQNMATNWIIALESAQRTTTAPLLDSSIRSASTQFVKNVGVSFSKTTQFTSGPQTLTSTNCGQLIDLASGYTGALTLPAISTIPDGGTIQIWSGAAAAFNVICAGADTIFVKGSTVTSITMNAGDTLILTCGFGSTWIAVGGSAQLQYAGAFASSITTPGWQKFPTGLILQWGASGGITAGGSTSVTFPLAFPNNLFSGGTFTPMSAGSTSLLATTGISFVGKTGFTVFAQGPGAVGATPWFAIGN